MEKAKAIKCPACGAEISPAPKRAKPPGKFWYVASPGMWFVIQGRVNNARDQGRKEFGLRFVNEIRPATPDEVADYVAQRGEEALCCD